MPVLVHTYASTYAILVHFVLVFSSHFFLTPSNGSTGYTAHRRQASAKWLKRTILGYSDIQRYSGNLILSYFIDVYRIFAYWFKTQVHIETVCVWFDAISCDFLAFDTFRPTFQWFAKMEKDAGSQQGYCQLVMYEGSILDSPEPYFAWARCWVSGTQVQYGIVLGLEIGLWDMVNWGRCLTFECCSLLCQVRVPLQNSTNPRGRETVLLTPLLKQKYCRL